MLVGMTVGIKVLNAGSQLVLAALLAPEIFGLFSTALAVSEITSVVKRIGIREVLVRRRCAVVRWANTAVWISLVLGVLGGLCILLFGPLMIRPELRDELRLPVYVFALMAPLQTMGVIPIAILQRDLRFGPVVLLQTGGVLVQAVGSIGLALGGIGVFALVLPRVVSELVQCVGGWMIARPSLRFRFDRMLWIYYLRSGALLFPAAMATTLTLFGDYYILSLFSPPELVGAYFIAFTLSTQVGQLLIDNLTKVLLPSLSALQRDVVRQARALYRSTRLLAVVAIPAYVLQALAAEPLLRLLYEDRWVDAIPVLQVLSLSGILAMMGAPSVSLLLAAGRYRAHLMLTVARTVLLLALVAVGAWQMGPVGAAVGVLFSRLILNPISFLVAGRPGGIVAADAFRVMAAPLGVASLAACAAILGLGLVPPEIFGSARAAAGARFLVAVVLLSLVYLAGMWCFARPLLSELVERVRDVLPNRGKGRARG